MIKKLKEADKELIVNFCYQREMESQFVLGSFKSYENSIRDNCFWGYFEEDKLIGLAAVFNRWNSFVVNAEKKEVIEDLVDEVIDSGRKIEYVPYFKKYADVIIERLKKHGLKPKKYDEQNFLILKKEDLDEYIRLGRESDGENLEDPIKESERKRVNLELSFALKIDGKIVSRATLHGASKNYFQIGGVTTKKSERGKGYAKRVVSSLCKHFFAKNIENAILYVDKDNLAALKVYKAIGFKKEGECVQAAY